MCVSVDFFEIKLEINRLCLFGFVYKFINDKNNEKENYYLNSI